MELKMHEYQLPEKILFNYEELKRELTEKVSHYETLVYTDDQIKEAKADKALHGIGLPLSRLADCIVGYLGANTL